MKKTSPQKVAWAAKNVQKPGKNGPIAVTRNMQVFRIARLVSLLKKNDLIQLFEA